eukprot:14195551-Alexandrium_andersonii.AAC.1
MRATYSCVWSTGRAALVSRLPPPLSAFECGICAYSLFNKEVSSPRCGLPQVSVRVRALQYGCVLCRWISAVGSPKARNNPLGQRLQCNTTDPYDAASRQALMGYWGAQYISTAVGAHTPVGGPDPSAGDTDRQA